MTPDELNKKSADNNGECNASLLTKREHFATNTLIGLLSSQAHTMPIQKLIDMSIKISDDLLLTLEKTKK